MAKRNEVDVYLLNVEPPTGHRVFYAEPRGAEREELPRHRGLRGWAETRLRKVGERWQHSRGQAARISRRAWEWLHSRTHPDEILLAQLRSARLIQVHYPASLGLEELAAAWAQFLAVGRRRHWAWFLGNALIAPLSVLLAPLPGPNLLGYWFAYRAVHHWLILVGLGRVRRGDVATRFRPSDALDGPSLPGHLDAGSIAAFLKGHGVRHRGDASDCVTTEADRGLGSSDG